jgi:Na+-transporting NADH:ubiquinone oxidoreductase subunit A
MNLIKVKKGYSLNLVGKPSAELESLPKPTHVGLLPERIPFIKPRLKIKVGDSIQIGSALIEDKRNPDIQFLSPGGGIVDDIDFGPRRVIRKIGIQLTDNEEQVQFERLSESDIGGIDRPDLVRMIVTGGLWPLFRELPFRDYPHPDIVPPAIYVGLGSFEPFMPLPHVYLTDRLDLFNYGLKVLQTLAPDRVQVCAAESDEVNRRRLNGTITLLFSGNYPAHDPGVLVYRAKTAPDQNRAWYIDGQNVLLLAHLLKHGTYPTERTVTLAGESAATRKHLITRLGAPLSHIATKAAGEERNIRYISGGVLTGFATDPQSYLGLFETALNLIPEGNRKGELLGLFRPGYRKASYSRVFFSALNSEDLSMNCSVHGGDRACIACGYCTEVCPVDILPQFTLKAILAGEIEEALQHGLLDCVECGLCSYVCPSKIELFKTLRNAKAEVYKEQGL